MIRRTPSPRLYVHTMLLLGVCLLGALAACTAAAANPLYSQIIVFGDSLSDTGNDAHASKAEYGVTFPGEDFNYTTGRFTNGSDTNPPSNVYAGVWHEQLAKLFLGLPAATNSLDGGMDYAYGGATTQMGKSTLSDSAPGFESLSVSLTVENMGLQVAGYLKSNTTDPKALYIVWGGANDLFDTATHANAIAAADRETALIRSLGQAGAATFLVPNLPPLGETPDYQDHDSIMMTQNAIAFGAELQSDLDTVEHELNAGGHPVKIYRLNVFGLFTRLLNNKYAYGFTDITDSAQGMSVKADQYLFWDGVHPTVAGHYQLAAEAYSVLTGTPVVEINALPGGMLNNQGALSLFYLTRTGEDLATTFEVPYMVGGTATVGTDFHKLKGTRQFLAGRHTMVIPVFAGTVPPTSPAKNITVTLQPGNGYRLSVVPAAKVKLLPQPGS
jgi:phospholipase/lecithinase/hemolysin